MSKGDLVYIESPFAKSATNSVEDHEEYARLCMIHSLELGEFPFASHLLYPQVLDDLVVIDRKAGMRAGESWALYADIRAIYTDLGTSRGMNWGEANATKLGQKIEYRSIHEEDTDD